MKLSKIAFACVAVASGSAFALPASQYTNTGEFAGDTVNIRISGASAQDNGILGTALSLCTAGSVHRYSISNNFVYFCTPDIGTNAGQLNVPAGKTKLAIYKYSVGGSAFGVTPVNSNVAASGAALGANGNLLPFLDLTKITTACTNAGATASFGPGLSTYVNIACTAASSALTTSATTYVGLSDVEPAFFSNTTGNLTVAQASALIFGVPVTLNIRNALQSQQGLTVGSETEANMPSLSSAQIASAYTQPGQVWNAIGVTSGLADDAIYIARRVDSSGTQKTFEALFAHSPNGETANKSCSVGTTLFAPPDSGNTSTGDADGTSAGTASGTAACTTAVGVYSASGGGNVRNCMINHNAANRGAIGILTTEDKYTTLVNAAAQTWRFVKVNGVSPTQANVAAGRYPYYTETSVQTRSAGAFATSAALGYPSFVSRLSSDLANATIIKLVNGADQSFGPAGLMALLSRQTAGTAADFTGTSSVIPWTKIGPTGLDNCQTPVLFN